MFSYEYCVIFKNSFFIEPPLSASVVTTFLLRLNPSTCKTCNGFYEDNLGLSNPSFKYRG